MKHQKSQEILNCLSKKYAELVVVQISASKVDTPYEDRVHNMSLRTSRLTI
jgi:hypothetical protein